MTLAPTTRAAIWVAKVPTPPAAAVTRIVSPFRSPSTSVRAWWAVSPATGTLAASSKESEAGLREVASADTARYSA